MEISVAVFDEKNRKCGASWGQTLGEEHGSIIARQKLFTGSKNGFGVSSDFLGGSKVVFGVTSDFLGVPEWFGHLERFRRGYKCAFYPFASKSTLAI